MAADAVDANGTVIVDADLTTITDEEVLKRHPGLMRPSGHLGFMGHGSRIEFRNLRILDLNAGPDPYNQTTPAEIAMLLEDIYRCAENGGGTFAAAFPGGRSPPALPG